MNAKAYRIETISNLHVGGMGDAISIVDLPVQRDVLTGYPTIHASSLKGALRKRCESTAEIWDEIDTIFGGRHDALNPTQGQYRFLQPLLLAWPVRAVNTAYVLATCPRMIDDALAVLEVMNMAEEKFALFLKQLRAEQDGKIYRHCLDGAKRLEAMDTEAGVLDVKDMNQQEELLSCFGGFLAKLSDEKMQELTEEIPVIARNVLDNGISKNLWYEEVVPRKTQFLTGILTEHDVFSEKLDTLLCTESIQIGANATVGCGVSKFHPIVGDGGEAR